ncbi:MAG: hypothetical protein EPN86_02820 [Nanoarchaeota archaeon]|nr:MAG: hypothetical protein EPN86_02820 [Nanoarchaeota archaeon]
MRDFRYRDDVEKAAIKAAPVVAESLSFPLVEYDRGYRHKILIRQPGLPQDTAQVLIHRFGIQFDPQQTIRRMVNGWVKGVKTDLPTGPLNAAKNTIAKSVYDSIGPQTGYWNSPNFFHRHDDYIQAENLEQVVEDNLRRVCNSAGVFLQELHGGKLSEASRDLYGAMIQLIPHLQRDFLDGKVESMEPYAGGLKDGMTFEELANTMASFYKGTVRVIRDEILFEDGFALYNVETGNSSIQPGISVRGDHYVQLITDVQIPGDVPNIIFIILSKIVESSTQQIAENHAAGYNAKTQLLASRDGSMIFSCQHLPQDYQPKDYAVPMQKAIELGAFYSGWKLREMYEKAAEVISPYSDALNQAAVQTGTRIAALL